MTKTGGRGATVRHIAGECALSVGMPKLSPPSGWHWVALTDIARLESGHTPSRRHSEYWGGDIPWLSIRDAKIHHGGAVVETIESTNELGIENSSARILPKGTVCLSRTASVGYVTIMECPMATSQDFVNWVCSEKLEPRFLQYLLICEKPSLARFSSGAVHQTIYFPEVKAFHICIPTLEEQRRIVAVLDEAFATIATATANAEKNLANARKLFEATVRETFGEPEPTWKLQTLKEASHDFGRGKSKHRPRNDPQLYGGDYPFIQTGDVRNSEHLITEYSQTYNAAGLAQSKLWPKGTICITIAANIAETGILNFDACFPDSVIGMVVDPARTSNNYVEYLLQSLKAVLQAKGKGSAQANINLATFENERFPFPPKDVQMAIVAQLRALSEQVQAMEAFYDDKLQALSALRQSLLHRAFTGRLTATEPATIAA